MFKYTVILGMLLVSSISYSQGFPSKDGVRCDNKVNTLKKVYEFSNDKEKKKLADLDAGTLNSGDCNTIYVRPPKLGNVEFINPEFGNNIIRCGPLAVRKTKLDRLMKQYSQTSNNAKADAIMAEVDALTVEVETKGASAPGIMTNVRYYTRWDDILAEYQSINPGKNIQKLPVFSLYLVSNIKDEDIQTFPHILRSTINGLRIKNEKGNTVTIGNEVEIESDFKSFLFGSSLSGALQMTLFHSCPLLGEQVDKDFVHKKLILGMQASLYYFYNIHSKRSYSIRISKKEDFRDRLKVFFTSNGFFRVASIRSFASELMERQIITIESIANEKGEVSSIADINKDAETLIQNAILSQGTTSSGSVNNGDSFVRFASNKIDSIIDGIASYIEKDVAINDLVINYDNIAFDVDGSKE